MKTLIVTEPFAGYAKGDKIIDADKIDEALSSNPNSVVAINLPDPAPSKSASSSDSQS